MWPLKSVFLWLSGQMAFDRVSLNVRSQKTKTSKGEKNTLQLHFLFACKPLRGDSWGSSQATSGHTCELLDSQLYAAALNVLIPTSFSQPLPSHAFRSISSSCPLLFLAPGSSGQYFFCLYFLQIPHGKPHQPWECRKWDETKTVPALLVLPDWLKCKITFLRRRSIIAPVGRSKPSSLDHCWLGAWNMLEGQFERPWRSLNKYSTASSFFISLFSGCNFLTRFLEKLKVDSEVFASLFVAFVEREDHGDSYSAIFCDTNLFVHSWYIY